MTAGRVRCAAPSFARPQVCPRVRNAAGYPRVTGNPLPARSCVLMRRCRLPSSSAAAAAPSCVAPSRRQPSRPHAELSRPRADPTSPVAAPYLAVRRRLSLRRAEPRARRSKQPAAALLQPPATAPCCCGPPVPPPAWAERREIEKGGEEAEDSRFGSRDTGWPVGLGRGTEVEVYGVRVCFLAGLNVRWALF